MPNNLTISVTSSPPPSSKPVHFSNDMKDITKPFVLYILLVEDLVSHA